MADLFRVLKAVNELFAFDVDSLGTSSDMEPVAFVGEELASLT